MKYHVAAIPAVGGEAAQAELNRFLAAHRVSHVERTLVTDGAGSFWAFCVTYVDGPAATSPATTKGRKPVDYKEILSDAQFQVFVRLRDLRRSLAEQDEVPAYSVFTNEQLAAMVQKPVRTLAELGALDGVGPGRLEKYGPAMIAALAEA